VAAYLKPGDMVKGSGPLGTSYLRSRHDGAMLCVGGGRGLGPIKSLVGSALHEGFASPLHLYFGVRGERDVYYERELAELHHLFAWFSAHIVVSERGAPAAAALLPRRQGLVTEAVAADFSQLAGYKAYFSRPAPLVDAAAA